MVDQIVYDLYYALIFLSPAYFANATAIFVSGLGRVDRGKNFIDGKPLLGSHKTNGGVIGATIGGGLLGIVAPLYFPEIFFASGLQGYEWYMGFILGFGAIFGDALGSFIKRRGWIKIASKPGGPFPIMDQIGFTVTAFLFITPFVDYPTVWLWIIPLTLIIHLAANSLAYFLGWKEVWY